MRQLLDGGADVNKARTVDGYAPFRKEKSFTNAFLVLPHDGSADSADISLGRGVPFQPIEGPASNTAGRAFSQCTSEGIGKLGRRSVVTDLSHSIAGTSVNTRAFNQVARQSVC